MTECWSEEGEMEEGEMEIHQSFAKGVGPSASDANRALCLAIMTIGC